MSRTPRAVLLGAVMVLVVGAGKRPPGLGDVTDIRVFDHPTHTRVVVELSRSASLRATRFSPPLPSPPAPGKCC